MESVGRDSGIAMIGHGSQTMPLPKKTWIGFGV